MNANTNLELCILKVGREKSVLRRHPWIFSGAIERVTGQPQNGDTVAVHALQGTFLGYAAYNALSKISARMWSWQESDRMDADFFHHKINVALAARSALNIAQHSTGIRLIHGEADGLPGLVVDQYNDVLVMQIGSAGAEKWREVFVEILQNLCRPACIYERSDSDSRTLEGLPERNGVLLGTLPDALVLTEHGIRFGVDVAHGQKTGFYLDQRENRILIGNLGVKGSCLDAFCYEGGFGLHLARGGAKEVMGIDSQSEAIARAQENCRLNGFSEDTVHFRTANVFDALKEFESQKKRFDLVVLDPPSFVKKKSALEGALAGYKEITLRSMKILNDPGLLAVFSCSHHVTDDLLMQVCMSAARDVRKSLKVIRFLKQSADHPIDPFIPETYYLKGFLLEITPL